MNRAGRIATSSRHRRRGHGARSMPALPARQEFSGGPPRSPGDRASVAAPGDDAGHRPAVFRNAGLARTGHCVWRYRLCRALPSRPRGRRRLRTRVPPSARGGLLTAPYRRAFGRHRPNRGSPTQAGMDHGRPGVSSVTSSTGGSSPAPRECRMRSFSGANRASPVHETAARAGAWPATIRPADSAPAARSLRRPPPRFPRRRHCRSAPGRMRGRIGTRARPRSADPRHGERLVPRRPGGFARCGIRPPPNRASTRRWPAGDRWSAR